MVRMYAVVSFKLRLVLAPDGDFYSGLPSKYAGYFLFATRKEAESASIPKFAPLPVYVDYFGRPHPAS